MDILQEVWGLLGLPALIWLGYWADCKWGGRKLRDTDDYGR